jgi:hypothetical protein
MDLDTALLWLALMGGAVTLVRGLQLWRRGERLIAIKGALVLAVTGVAHLLVPDHEGAIGAIVWTILVLGTNVLAQSLGRAVARQEYTRARLLATALYALHPSPAMRLAMLDRRATSLFHAGDEAGAERVYLEAAKLPGARAWADITRLRMLGRWEELVATYRTEVTAD